MKQRMTSREWEELKALSRVDYIGPERADVSRQRAAIGVMSSMAKLPAGYSANWMLPNPPETPEQTPEEMLAALESLGKTHNAKWPSPSENSPPS